MKADVVYTDDISEYRGIRLNGLLKFSTVFFSIVTIGSIEI